ncbi:MAG: YfhO family protein [Gemmatimonadales bacterium]|jgi:hypothetical protein
MKRKNRTSNAKQAATGATESPAVDAWLPGWAPYVAFALLAIFLFREFVISNGMVFGTDVIALGYFARHFYAEMIRTAHTVPHWDPYIFAGLPFVDAMHGDIFYPTTILKFLIPVHRAMGWKLVIHVFLAGVVTYGWLRHLRVSRPIAMFGGLTYMLAPVLVTLVYPGHDGKMFVTALTPLALWVTDRAITQGGSWRFATLASVVALLIFTAHMQLAYFATWALVVLAVFRLLQARREGKRGALLARRFGAFAVAGIIGALAMGAIQTWAPVRYLTKYSQRVERTTQAEAESGYAYSTSWSLHPEEAFSLVVPEFIGANLQTNEAAIQTYWGRNPFKLNHEYAGLVPLLLLPLAIIARRRRAEVWLFTGLAVASLVYALGATTPFFRLFYWLVPGVKLFRAPSSIMFVFAIAVVTAAALGLEGLRNAEGEEDWQRISRRGSIYLWSAAGFFLLLALLGSTGMLTEIWTGTIYAGMDPAKLAALQINMPNITRGLWLSTLLAALVAAGWHLRSRGMLPHAGWIVAIAVLSVLDLMRVNPQFIRVVNPGTYFPRDDVTEYLLREQRESNLFRVFPLPGAPYQPNHFALHGLEEFAGHHGNELGRARAVTNLGRPGVNVVRLLQALNVTYIVSGAPLDVPELREMFRGQRSIVYKLKSPMERAFLVGQIEVVPDSLALKRLSSGNDFFPRVSAMLESEPDFIVEAGATGRVRWREWGINNQKLEVEASGPALLVVSDNYYPAWRATVDGEPVPVVRANYLMRAVPVPAGAHQVEFVYNSGLFRASVWTSLASILAVFALIGVGLFSARRGRGAAGSV